MHDGKGLSSDLGSLATAECGNWHGCGIFIILFAAWGGTRIRTGVNKTNQKTVESVDKHWLLKFTQSNLTAFNSLIQIYSIEFPWKEMSEFWQLVSMLLEFE